MRDPDEKELTRIRGLSQAHRLALAELKCCLAELEREGEHLRTACGMPSDALLDEALGKWVRNIGRGPDGQPIRAPVIQERATTRGRPAKQ